MIKKQEKGKENEKEAIANQDGISCMLLHTATLQKCTKSHKLHRDFQAGTRPKQQ